MIKWMVRWRIRRSFPGASNVGQSHGRWDIDERLVFLGIMSAELKNFGRPQNHHFFRKLWLFLKLWRFWEPSSEPVCKIWKSLRNGNLVSQLTKICLLQTSVFFRLESYNSFLLKISEFSWKVVNLSSYYDVILHCLSFETLLTKICW